jgi:alkylation response protein AidB-like acyl-CoA dehydrogenase
MDLSYSAEYEAFRVEVRAFLDEHWTAADRGRYGEERIIGTIAKPDERQTEFRMAAIERGYLYRNVPRAYGGGEQPFDPLRSAIIREEFKRARAPREMVGQGPSMLVFTLLDCGTEEQKTKFIRDTLLGRILWCQGYSEPGAGSDLASLRTRAELDGDHWVVNGQKIWTSNAEAADWMFALVRTEPDAPKHDGITYMLIDMKTPGIDVRPLRQMTGEAEFNEVYFTDVRIPDGLRLDAEGQGWGVSITTLMNERVSIGGGTPPRGSGPIGQLVELWRKQGSDDPVARDRVTALWIQAEVNRLTNLRAAANRRSGTPGPEGSVAKLAMAELNKAIYSTAMDLLGAEGMTYGSYDLVRPRHALFTDDMHKNFLRARANSIEGGTSEVLRNILGERVLGLPGDVRVDKELPWREVPRS